MNGDTNTAQIEMPEDIAVDPVCGATVDLDRAREQELLTEFAEREYAFCGDRCRDRFVARPVAFAVSGRSEP